MSNIGKTVCWFLMSLLYPIGETIQNLKFGPAWLTGHLSDLGFVFSAGLLFNFSLRPKMSLVSAWAFAMVFEGYQFMVHQGDVYDAILFTIALVIGLCLTKGNNKKLHE